MKVCAPCQLKHKLVSNNRTWSDGRCDICKEECNITETRETNEDRTTRD